MGFFARGLGQIPAQEINRAHEYRRYAGAGQTHPAMPVAILRPSFAPAPANFSASFFALRHRPPRRPLDDQDRYAHAEKSPIRQQSSDKYDHCIKTHQWADTRHQAPWRWSQYRAECPLLHRQIMYLSAPYRTSPHPKSATHHNGHKFHGCA